MDESLLDDIISLLLVSAYRVRSRHVVVNVQLLEYEAHQLCLVSRDIFLREPSLLQLKAPIKIAGDIHGHYNSLLKLLEYGGLPPKSNYLFLGNYVDFGKQSLETIWLLLALKIKYPQNVFLLRGNHECTSINSTHGFRDECMRRFNSKLWNVFNECFNCLPVAALIDDKVLCVHGGISPNLQDLDQIRNIERPIDDPFECLFHDLLWSNPSRGNHGWCKNEGRRVSYTFGADEVKEFLEKHDLDLICRGHQVVKDGYEFFADQQLVTIFSAPNQRAPNGREYYNAGALMSVDENLICSFYILQPFDGSVKLGLNYGSSASTSESGNSLGVHFFPGRTTKKSEDVPLMMKHVERANNSNFESTQGVNPSKSKIATKYTSTPPSVELVERINKSNSGRNTSTTKLKVQSSTQPTKYRSNSPGFKGAESTSKTNSRSSNITANSKISPGTNHSKFDFDPSSLYRSKSPGVKRFLGARV